MVVHQRTHISSNILYVYADRYCHYTVLPDNMWKAIRHIFQSCAGGPSGKLNVFYTHDDAHDGIDWDTYVICTV